MNANQEMQGISYIRTGQTITNELLVTLINKDVVRKGTELLIPRAGRDLAGNNSILFDHVVEVIETKIKDGIGYCLARSTEDNAPFRVSAKSIYLLDGMDPSRIAHSFGFKLDGSPRSSGKKRGRKPKNRK